MVVKTRSFMVMTVLLQQCCASPWACATFAASRLTMAMPLHCRSIPSHASCASSLQQTHPSQFEVHPSNPNRVHNKHRITTSALHNPDEAREYTLWFDKQTTIPLATYMNTAAITRDLTRAQDIHLPYCRPGLPFTTIFSDECDQLAEMLRKAVGVGERRRNNVHGQQQREVLSGGTSANTSRELFVSTANSKKIRSSANSGLQGLALGTAHTIPLGCDLWFAALAHVLAQVSSPRCQAPGPRYQDQAIGYQHEVTRYWGTGFRRQLPGPATRSRNQVTRHNIPRTRCKVQGHRSPGGTGPWVSCTRYKVPGPDVPNGRGIVHVHTVP